MDQRCRTRRRSDRWKVTDKTRPMLVLQRIGSVSPVTTRKAYFIQVLILIVVLIFEGLIIPRGTRHVKSRACKSHFCIQALISQSRQCTEAKLFGRMVACPLHPSTTPPRNQEFRAHATTNIRIACHVVSWHGSSSRNKAFCILVSSLSNMALMTYLLAN
jgi:hypothetical protein